MRLDIYEQLCGQDWAAIGKDLLAHTEWKTAGYYWRKGPKVLAKGHQAQDIVNLVIKKTFSGARKWDPERGALVPWLKRQIDSEVSTLFKSADHRHERRFVEPNAIQEDESGAVTTAIPDRNPDPLETMILKEEQERAKKVVADLLGAIDHDHDLVEEVECILEGYGPEPRFLAEQLNTSTNDINNRFKRLFRYARKVVKP